MTAKERKRIRYNMMKSNNVCVTCGRKTDGFTRCPECRQYMKIHKLYTYNRKSEAAKRLEAEKIRNKRKLIHDQRVTNGLCVRCGSENNNGKLNCDRCLKMYRESRIRAKMLFVDNT